jgi:phosphoribosyl 1,2-cyclic phosphodiesterase
MNDQLHGQNYSLAVCVLASGSKGNAIYVSDGDTAILVDAGLSGKEIERRLHSRGLTAETLNAIVVSHEHSDHIRGVGVLSRRYRIPVYMSHGTHETSGSQIGKPHQVVHFSCGETFSVGTLMLHPFSISHDAQEPAGFTINQNGVKIGIATDLGIGTGMVKEHLKHCALLILEANHDPAMLIEGPYPWYLKQRIKGRTGHLSNDASRQLLDEVQHEHLRFVILAHLSEVNNSPDIARQVVGEALSASRTQLTVAVQDQSGDVFRLP